ncbi:Fic family protein [Desulfatibacillum aliphaticivorans]|uniref:Fic family protein n=1 Tax=Desulfatibacillum aliphaticivorans TaxID=218208 RepID=UPI00041C379C|nr:Fic family protein [Desulfatibacillum aliphaticivorans]
MSNHKWKPIEDLQDDWRELASHELAAFFPIWAERKVRLGDSMAFDLFNKKLIRQWAIETGIIEGLYTIDRGVTQVLIEEGIKASLIPHGSLNKPVSEVAPLIKDQENVVEGLFDFVSQKRQLSTSYIKQIHQALTIHQDYVDGMDSLGSPVRMKLLKGEWKTLENNPSRPNGSLHQYCPPEHAAAEMDRLVSLHHQHSEMNVPPEIEAAWLHHRFTQIHPFQDGNGRVARALASLVFIRAGWFPLVLISEEHRTEYIEALEHADAGDLAPLVNMFARIQRKAFIKALGISEDVLTEKTTMDAMLQSISEKLQDRTKASSMEASEKQKVFEYSKELESIANDKFVGLRDRLSAILADSAKDVSVSVLPSKPSVNNIFRNQILKAAEELDYFADTLTYHAWVRLLIDDKPETRFVLSFHSLGSEFAGVLACSAFLDQREFGENGEVDVQGPVVICPDPFQFSYNQELPQIISSFEKWLDQALLYGLAQWKQSL